MTNYTQLPQLGSIYLEDSYVLSIAETPGQFVFKMEAVLTPEHPAYHKPRAGEQYCYADGMLVFSHVASVEWVRRSDNRSVDASGAEDLGNIDSLTYRDGVFAAEGDWGEVRIHSSANPTFELYAEM